MILFVADLFHPLNCLSVELFLDGNVCHGRRCRGAVPMLLSRREPDHITRPNFLNMSAVTLNPATTSRDNESLTKWMRVPCSACAGLERNAGTLNPCRLWRLKKWIDPYSACEPVRWPLARGLRSNSSNFHFGFT